MRITKKQLKRLIQEELEEVLGEIQLAPDEGGVQYYEGPPGYEGDIESAKGALEEPGWKWHAALGGKRPGYDPEAITLDYGIETPMTQSVGPERPEWGIEPEEKKEYVETGIYPLREEDLQRLIQEELQKIMETAPRGDITSIRGLLAQISLEAQHATNDSTRALEMIKNKLLTCVAIIDDLNAPALDADIEGSFPTIRNDQ